MKKKTHPKIWIISTDQTTDLYTVIVVGLIGLWDGPEPTSLSIYLATHCLETSFNVAPWMGV